jgi:putative SOS response-associated peptidase YedK
MCNLYSVICSQAAVRLLARSMRDIAGNVPPLPGIYPDQTAPVVRTAPDGVRELAMMRWGFPSPSNTGNHPVINVRNSTSGWWRPWLQAGHRCLVPVTSFCEHQEGAKSGAPKWFARDDTRPLFFFVGIWRPFFGERNGEPGEHLLFSILITAPNAMMAPVNSDAMPVLLLDEASRETWLTGSLEDALALQSSAPDDAVHMVAGENQEG